MNNSHQLYKLNELNEQKIEFSFDHADYFFNSII